MRIECDIDVEEVLKQINAEDIADFYKGRRDIDDLLSQIGTAAIVRYLQTNESIHFVLDEMAETSDIEEHIADLRAWEIIKEKEKAAM